MGSSKSLRLAASQPTAWYSPDAAVQQLTKNGDTMAGSGVCSWCCWFVSSSPAVVKLVTGLVMCCLILSLWSDCRLGAADAVADKLGFTRQNQS